MRVATRWRILVAVLIPAISSCASIGEKNSTQAAETLSPPTRQEFISTALAGDLSDMPRRFSTSAAQGDKRLKEQFKAAFIDRTEPVLEIDDPAVERIAKRYVDYWRDALLAPSTISELEDKLAQDVSDIARDYGADISPDNMTQELKEFIESRGMLAITGRTLPLLELIVWSENARIMTRVELTDGEYEIPVTYLRGFLLRGWSYFATFGAASTGGWTNSEGLFCVEESYDLDSENFKVSFLKHEGRHYADNRLYPDLQQVDLEYRAKLTELYFADETLARLIDKFYGAAAQVETAPHSMANWRVIHDLSQILLSKDWPEKGELQTLPAEQIKKAAKDLLDRHTAKLEANG